MREETRQVYYCDHCRKYGLSKANIKKHEQFCFGNPENVPRCFDGCAFLSQGLSPDGGRYYKCSKQNIGMFTKKQIVLGRKIADFNAIEMPIGMCSHFEVEKYPDSAGDANFDDLFNS